MRAFRAIGLGGFLGAAVLTLGACGGSAESQDLGPGNASTGSHNAIAGLPTVVARPMGRGSVRSDFTQPTCSQSGVGAFVGANNSNVSGEYAAIPGGKNNEACGYYAFIGAGFGNGIVSGSYGSTISGGWQNYALSTSGYATIAGGTNNVVAADYGVIGGGGYSTIGASAGDFDTIAGGYTNTVSQQYGSVGGGNTNTVNGSYGTIAGGSKNVVNNAYGVIAGGYNNQAGDLAVVPGGDGNIALGKGSFAAGVGSTANYTGDFVWSDFATGATALKGTAPNQFLARASGGVTLYSSANLVSGVRLAAGSGTWSSLSDRHAKRDIVSISDDAMLDKVAALPISEWSYTTERGVRHVGPMAQDFYSAFHVGEDDRHITSIDEDGVALAAIKALNGRLAQKDREIQALRREMTALAVQMRALQHRR